MTKTIIKFGVLLGISLFIVSLATEYFIQNYNSRASISWVIGFGLTGGMMIFGINEILKEQQKKIKYTYQLGLGVSLLIGLIGWNFANLSLMIKIAIFSDIPFQIEHFINVLFSFNPTIFFLSILCPTAFINKVKKLKNSIGNDDILDLNN